MDFVRCLTVAKTDVATAISNELSANYQFKMLASNDGASLFIYEGMGIPVFEVDYDDSYTVGINGREPTYYFSGNDGLAPIFNIRINLGFGISIEASKKNKVPASAKLLIEKLEKISQEIEVTDERYNIRFDAEPENWLSPLPKEKSPTKLIDDLSSILKKSKIPFRATLFQTTNGEVRGELSDAGLYIGPAAYIFATFHDGKNEKLSTELILNHEEILIDGNSAVDLLR
jgi:hypothetical protein